MPRADESWETVDTEIIMDSQPTQQATQPVDDPGRLGRNLSNISDSDATDVICLLCPSSPAAFEAVKTNMLKAPDHILQNADLDGVAEHDILSRSQTKKTRDIALRMSSKVKVPKDGFRFGRTRGQVDVLLTGFENDSHVSKVHFKIFVNSQGSLMLEDLSTNGTFVDDTMLKAKHRGNRAFRPATMALKHGAIISLLNNDKAEIKFVVRIPARGDNEDTYEKNLRSYLAARGEVAQFASMKESTYHNHWNGGSLYNFTGTVGQGAFATVYRVQTKNDGNVFAAKELDKRRFIKNGVLDLKFDSELNIMKTLKHPNIVNYVDCHLYSHWIYIIMEFVPHGELSREMRRCGKIPESDGQQITRQILHALDYLHRRNITHRDIKPDNILVAQRSPLIVKLTDFGLSKCVSDQETFLKTFCGTLLYCAPEVYPDYPAYAQGSVPKRRRLGEPAVNPPPSPYDQSVDMWSFGAVIFHMLSGNPPISGRGDDRGAQMLNNIMTQDIDFEPLRQANVSDDAIDFIRRLLNRNALLRPKEPECLKHPWLIDVPDNCIYDDVEEPASLFEEDAEIADEMNDDLIDDDLLTDLNQLTEPLLSSQSPDRPTKRARTDQTTLGKSADGVTYPVLPEPGASFLPVPSAPPAQRLFGEIHPSALQSSGIFGVGNRLTTPNELHDLQDGVEQISVNDFENQTAIERSASADNSGQPLQYPHVFGVPHTQIGSASSLQGAEQQIGQLNMTSPEGDISDAATPETTNPVTPQTRDLSPSASVAQQTGQSEESDDAEKIEEPIFTRRVDLGLIGDPVHFETQVLARNASRAGKLREKAETFHGNGNARQRLPSIELAATIDANTGVEVRSAEAINRLIRIAREPSEIIGRASDTTKFVRPPKRFGKLVSIQGSFTNVVVNLEQRFTLWGRGLDCTVQYPDSKDTRIPVYAIKVTFWAPGMEAHVERGGDWIQVAGVRTIIATSASGCIWVNDVELRRESPNGDAALFGKLYTGDTITISDNRKGSFLKLRAEITFGDSAKPRPASEAGFVVQEERRHHQRRKEKESMKLSMMDNERDTGAPPIVRVETE